MDSKQFASRLARNIGSDVKTVNTLVAALGKVFTEKCGELDSVALPGFGNLVAMKKAEHISTDEQGRRMLVPPKITVEFVAGAMLKKRVRP